jgi:hypothetical protein
LTSSWPVVTFAKAEVSADWGFHGLLATLNERSTSDTRVKNVRHGGGRLFLHNMPQLLAT